jgi:hypothetical protein
MNRGELPSDPGNCQNADENEVGSGGPNLVLMYTLLGVALVAALAFAAAIVWPFFIRR